MHIYKGAVFLYNVVIFYYSNTLQICHEYIFEKKIVREESIRSRSELHSPVKSHPSSVKCPRSVKFRSTKNALVTLHIPIVRKGRIHNGLFGKMLDLKSKVAKCERTVGLHSDRKHPVNDQTLPQNIT